MNCTSEAPDTLQQHSQFTTWYLFKAYQRASCPWVGAVTLLTQTGCVEYDPAVNSEVEDQLVAWRISAVLTPTL